MPQKILVTGGSGFIGTHLCRALSSDGHDVRVLDLRAPERAIEGVKYRLGDIRKPEDVIASVQGVDAIFHLAAEASVAVCQGQPQESTRTNLLGTILLMEKMNPKTRFIFSSTAAVYGSLGEKGVPIPENLGGLSMLSHYASQKRASENAIALFHGSRGIPAVVFRFFNAFGPGQDPSSPYSGVISIFKESLKKRVPIRLFGDGEQTRDFVSVHDLIRGLKTALLAKPEDCDGQPINLGSGIPCSIRTLANEMMKASGVLTPIETAAAREGDVMHSLADIKRAGEILGWKPKTSLSEGLTELLRTT